MVVFVTRYHKGYQLSGDVKIIHRYLPREAGDLLVKYMWLVLPFERKMEVLMGKEGVEGHVWSQDFDGKKWTSERMRKALKGASMVGMGVTAWHRSNRHEREASEK